MFFGKKKMLQDNEIILSQNVSLNMDGRKTRRNINTFIVGEKHVIRTRSCCLPNLMQMNGSYVAVDPEGTLQESTEQMFKDNGYDVKVLDVVHPEKSNHYNPFSYIREDLDAITFVDALVKNFDKNTIVSDSEFLRSARKALIQAIVFFLYKECPQEERTFKNINKLLDAAEVKDEDYKSPLDIIFEDLAKKDSDHIAVISYSLFKKIPAVDANKIVIDCKVNLSLFNINEYSELTETDDLDIGSIGTKPTVLYIRPTIFPSIYNSRILPVFFTQLFETLYYTAESSCKGHTLPVHVRVMLNFFGAYGVIPDIARFFATMRIYNISCAVQVPIERIRSMYPGDWKSIAGNCDLVVYPVFDSEALQENISLLDYFIEPPRNKFHKPSLKGCPATVSGKVKLIGSADEFLSLEQGQCVVAIRGCFPMVDSIYNCETHPNYKYVQEIHE